MLREDLRVGGFESGGGDWEEMQLCENAEYTQFSDFQV